MSYTITAENYDPVFCTPYENKYKDGYNPVTLTEAYRVPSNAKIQIWQSIVRFCHSLGGVCPTIYSHNAQRFTACFYAYINAPSEDTPIFVVITPTRMRWMFVNDNRDRLKGVDYLGRLVTLLCRVDDVRCSIEYVGKEARVHIPISQSPETGEVINIVVVYDYVDETMKLYGGLTKKEQSITDHISMIPIYEIYKRIMFCVENKTTTYDGRKIRRH